MDSYKSHLMKLLEGWSDGVKHSVAFSDNQLDNNHTFSSSLLTSFPSDLACWGRGEGNPEENI